MWRFGPRGCHCRLITLICTSVDKEKWEGEIPVMVINMPFRSSFLWWNPTFEEVFEGLEIRRRRNCLLDKFGEGLRRSTAGRLVGTEARGLASAWKHGDHKLILAFMMLERESQRIPPDFYFIFFFEGSDFLRSFRGIPRLASVNRLTRKCQIIEWRKG